MIRQRNAQMKYQSAQGATFKEYGRAIFSQERRCIEWFARQALNLFDSLGQWQERMSQRRQLMMLDARALADIGISRADAEAEYSKMPWRR